jgi:hypothetical protein
LLAKNCGIKNGYKGLRQIIKDNDGRNLNFNAKDAVKFGIVDKIGTPIISSTIQYSLKLKESKKSDVTNLFNSVGRKKTATKRKKR